MGNTSLIAPAAQALKKDRFFAALSLFIEGGMKVRVAVTDLDAHERLQFGPFSLSGTPRWRDSFAVSRWVARMSPRLFRRTARGDRAFLQNPASAPL